MVSGHTVNMQTEWCGRGGATEYFDIYASVLDSGPGGAVKIKIMRVLLPT